MRSQPSALNASSASAIFLGWHGRGCSRVSPSWRGHLPIVLSCTSTENRRDTSACKSTQRPAHDLVLGRIGVRDDQRFQLRHLGRAQRRRTARAAMRLQAVDPRRITFQVVRSKMASAAGRSIARLPFAEFNAAIHGAGGRRICRSVCRALRRRHVGVEQLPALTFRGDWEWNGRSSRPQPLSSCTSFSCGDGPRRRGRRRRLSRLPLRPRKERLLALRCRRYRAISKKP